MLGETYLSQENIQLITNIYMNFKNNPVYSKYDISMVENAAMGAIDIYVEKNGQPVNRFMFCGSLFGELNSIAIYGAQLNGHLKSIKSSMRIFGLKVSDVEIDYEGLSPYVDVTLE